MKKLTHLIKTGAFVLLTSLSIVSCVDGNDWETIDGNRLFGTTSFSVSPAAITAEVTWDATPNTEYYIIEASLEQMNNDTPMGEASGSIVYGEDKSIKKSPYILTGLQGETTYYLRIKSVSTGKESRWIYLEDATFKTDKEEILGTVPSENITEESVLLTWEAGLEVTHILLKTGTETAERQDITTDEATNGQKLIVGLLPGTEYTISIYNGEARRGETTVTTVMPEMVEFNSVQATKTSVSLVWDPEAIQTGSTTVSHYAWCEGNRTPNASDNYTALTGEQIAQGLLEITGFEPSTTYTVALMRGTYVRAMTTFTTVKGIPNDYELAPVSDIDSWNDAMKKIGKVAILIQESVNLDLAGITAEIPQGITSLLIWGADPEGNITTTKPGIKTKGFRFNDAFDTVEFYNLHLYSNGSSGNYIIDNQNVVNNSINNIIIESCVVDEARGLFRIRNTATCSWQSVLIKDCDLNGIGDYGLFTIDGGTFNKISISNSTMNNTYKIIKAKQTGITLNIDHCTIFGAGYVLVDGQSGNININATNTLVGGLATQKVFEKGATLVTDENVFTTSESKYESGKSWGSMLTIPATELFANPTNGDFTVQLDEYKAYGDQRWNK